MSSVPVGYFALHGPMSMTGNTKRTSGMDSNRLDGVPQGAKPPSVLPENRPMVPAAISREIARAEFILQLRALIGRQHVTLFAEQAQTGTGGDRIVNGSATTFDLGQCLVDAKSGTVGPM